LIDNPELSKLPHFITPPSKIANHPLIIVLGSHRAICGKAITRPRPITSKMTKGMIPHQASPIVIPFRSESLYGKQVEAEGE